MAVYHTGAVPAARILRLPDTNTPSVTSKYSNVLQAVHDVLARTKLENMVEQLECEFRNPPAQHGDRWSKRSGPRLHVMVMSPSYMYTLEDVMLGSQKETWDTIHSKMHTGMRQLLRATNSLHDDNMVIKSLGLRNIAIVSAHRSYRYSSTWTMRQD